MEINKCSLMDLLEIKQKLDLNITNYSGLDKESFMFDRISKDNKYKKLIKERVHKEVSKSFSSLYKVYRKGSIKDNNANNNLDFLVGKYEILSKFGYGSPKNKDMERYKRTHEIELDCGHHEYIFYTFCFIIGSTASYMYYHGYL
jgi:hypothetical protein